MKTITAFAPATVSNLAVGFDILGFPIDGVGDTVSLTVRDDKQLVIQSIEAEESLPLDITKNTATVALAALLHDHKIAHGFDIVIKKGIPLGSGMGGSGASAVAALVAGNAFLPKPLSKLELAKYALLGEKAASGQAHGDNVIPCLFGGLTLIQSIDPVKVIALPIPEITAVILHPHLIVETKKARELLKPEQPLKNFVQQSGNLASFISALYENDLHRMRDALKDALIEQHRAQLVPGFYAAQAAALEQGAIGCSLSGSGPSMFAFAKTQNQAEVIAKVMQKNFANIDIKADYCLSAISEYGAKLSYS